VASEEGVLVRIDAAGAWVKTIRGDACESCSSKAACHTMGGGREMEVSAANPIGARVGDRVVIKMDTPAFLKGTFLVYMFPILLLVGGAAIGEWASRSSSTPSPLPSILCAFGGLAVGLVLMKIIANRLARRDDYRPRIARVIGRPPALRQDD
jgi:sigma-E factor negative regulatory protein RseC